MINVTKLYRMELPHRAISVYISGRQGEQRPDLLAFNSHNC